MLGCVVLPFGAKIQERLRDAMTQCSLAHERETSTIGYSNRITDEIEHKYKSVDIPMLRSSLL